MAERQRDLFPLPELFDCGTEIATNLPSSRKSRSRLHQRRATDAIAKEAVRALNHLAGYDDFGLELGRRTAAHLSVKEHILEGVRAMGPDVSGATPAEAFGALRGASVYEEEPSCSVKALDMSLVSLPAAGSSPESLATLYGTGGHRFVEDFRARSLAQQEEVKEALRTAP